MKLLSTKPIVIDVDTTLKSEELLTTSKSDEENEKEKRLIFFKFYEFRVREVCINKNFF